MPKKEFFFSKILFYFIFLTFQFSTSDRFPHIGIPRIISISRKYNWADANDIDITHDAIKTNYLTNQKRKRKNLNIFTDNQRISKCYKKKDRN